MDMDMQRELKRKSDATAHELAVSASIGDGRIRRRLHISRILR